MGLAQMFQTHFRFNPLYLKITPSYRIMQLFFRKAHRIFYLAMVICCFALCFPILWLLAKNPEKHFNKLVFFRKWISKISAALSGIRFEYHFEEPIDWSIPYVLCPNHTSILDISVLTHLCPQPFSFIGKAELLKNPVTAIFFRSIDIPVDRNNRMSAFRAFKSGHETLQKGRSLVVFPEGKIDDEYPPRLHPFKSGPFRLAQENNVAILPIIIHNAWDLFWDDGARFGTKPGVIKVSVLRPILPNADVSNTVFPIEDLVYSRMNESWLSKK